jgi:hypothetical protein
MKHYLIRKFSIAWWTVQLFKCAAATAGIILLTMDYYIH